MKNLYNLTGMILTMVLFFSCYDDKSKSPYQELPEIIIDTTGSSQPIEYRYGTEFVFSPEITLTNDRSVDLHYEWKINLSSISLNSSSFSTISTEKELRIVFSNMPSTQPYLLVLSVTDSLTGITSYAEWDLLVTSGLGEGLVVADTRDGTTSDLHHIASSKVTQGYTGEDVITRDFYSTVNGEMIEGVVNHLKAGTFITLDRKYQSRMYIGTDRDLFTIDPSTFAINNEAEDLFWVQQPGFVASDMGHGPNMAFYSIIDGRIFMFVTNATIGGKFGAPENFIDETMLFTKFAVSESNQSGPKIGYSGYDEINGQFLIKASSIYTAISILTGSFTGHADLKDYEYIAAGLGYELDHLHLLKKKNSGEYFIFRITKDPDNEIIPHSVREVTSLPGLSSAISYVFCDNQDIVYYATKSKIYAAAVGNNPVSASEQNVINLASGEEITGIQMFYQNWYEIQWNNTAKTPMAENARQLIVSTYNSSTEEGKIYLVPIEALHTGRLGQPVKVFGGFKKITAIGVQQ